MKQLLIPMVILVMVFSVSYRSISREQEKIKQDSKVAFIVDNAEKKIDVLVDDELFTSYRWPDNITKPVLYPVYTSEGTKVTRGFPIEPKPGERPDHAHQIGMWLTYGDVQGYDFWGNGSQGLGTKNKNGGSIIHQKVEKISGGTGEGLLVTSGSWVDNTRKELLKELTEYHFLAKGNTRIIDRVTTLKADETEIMMSDTKEGMFAIRVARQLELPSEGVITVLDNQGNPVKTDAISNADISGNYLSSEGVTGLKVWGTRAKWMCLYGNIGGEKISVVICDHPKNPNYPTYWHARGYGLFAANPLGVRDFTKNTKEMNFSIPAGKSTIFRYRVIISSGSHLTDREINSYADDFASKY